MGQRLVTVPCKIHTNSSMYRSRTGTTCRAEVCEECLIHGGVQRTRWGWGVGQLLCILVVRQRILLCLSQAAAAWTGCVVCYSPHLTSPHRCHWNFLYQSGGVLGPWSCPPQLHLLHLSSTDLACVSLPPFSWNRRSAPQFCWSLSSPSSLVPTCFRSCLRTLQKDGWVLISNRIVWFGLAIT